MDLVYSEVLLMSEKLTMQEKEIVNVIRELVKESHDTQIEIFIDLIERHEVGPHHQFVSAEIQREERRQEMWDRVKGNFIFWLVTGITGAIGLALWHHFVDKQ